MSEPGAVGRLKDLGWDEGSLAFFHELPVDEVKKLLPDLSASWGEEEFHRRTLPRVSWKICLHKMVRTATTEDQRRRQRWIKELVKLMREAGFTDRLAAQSQDRVQYST